MSQDEYRNMQSKFNKVNEVKEEVEVKVVENARDDKVNHPNHYTQGEIEVINYIRDKLGADEFTGYCIGNVMKYISR